MIITKLVAIKVNPSNLKNLRRFLPDIKSNEVIEIPVDYLSNSSHTKVICECDVCHVEKEIPYRLYSKSISNGGYYTCSQKCSKQKVISTNLKRYGTEKPSQSPEIKDRIKKSFMEKYGVENISFLPEIVEKIKLSVNRSYSNNLSKIKEKQRLTNIEKYGVEDVNKEKWFKLEIVNRNIEKYGVSNPSSLEVTKDKLKRTCIDKYGFDSPLKSELVKNKIKKTNIEKYGVENVFKSEIIKDKIKKTNIEKYGCEYPSQSPEFYEKLIISGFRIKKHKYGLNYQGTYEKDFLDFCFDRGIKISKPSSFLYKMESKIKRYYPDFYYEDIQLIIEVKSMYYYNLHKEKNELKRKSIIDSGFKYILILDKNYEEFIKLITHS